MTTLNDIRSSRSLDELLTNLRAYQTEHPEESGEYADSALDRLMTDLPTFGGDEPAGGAFGVWSWDASRKLVGSCVSDMQIVPRDY